MRSIERFSCSEELKQERRRPGEAALVQMGELSARQHTTRSALQNLAKRPPVLRDPIPGDIMNAMPPPRLLSIQNGAHGIGAAQDVVAAAHLRVLLESDHTALFRAAQDLSRAHIPPLLRMGRLTLQKPGGGVRVLR